MSVEINEQQIFRFFDNENKNSINKSKVGEALRALGIIKTKTDINLLVKSLEEEINFEEFKTLVDNARKTQINKDNLLTAFEVFDEGKTGKCDANELFHCLKSIGEKLSEEDIENLKEKVSVDSDGKIDYKKIIDVLLK